MVDLRDHNKKQARDQSSPSGPQNGLVVTRHADPRPRFQPPSSADGPRLRDLWDQMADFVSSSIPLERFIHALRPPPPFYLHHQQQDDRAWPGSLLSNGTVTSFVPPTPNSPSRNAATSPMPRRTSVDSRITVDCDGWWSAQQDF